MDKAILIKGGTVFTGEILQKADVLVENGIIQQIGEKIKDVRADVFFAEGLIISPGFTDLHVHLREPGLSYKETIKTGTQAAAAGGFTTVCAMPNVDPVPDCPDKLKMQLDMIARDALVEVIPYGAVTKSQMGLELADIKAMAPFCAGFSDDGKGIQSRKMMREAMKRIAEVKGLLAAHCEDEGLVPASGCVHDGCIALQYALTGIPSKSEWMHIQRDIELLRETGVRYHVCHISAKESVALVREAKRQGMKISCECTPHQLMLCDEDISEDHGRFKMNPPLRSREDREAIIEGLIDGTIDCIATDHAPHAFAEKNKGLEYSSFGITGLETAFSVCNTALVQTGLMTMERLLEKLTKAPAGLLMRKQDLKAGSRANLTLLDPDTSWTVRSEKFFSMGKATPFEGMELTGKVVATFFNGKKVFEAGLAKEK